MTEKLYEVDSYVQNFTAQVVSCTPVPGGFAVVLDRTAFFPEGGGQPCDTGRLGGARVLAVHTDGETITHTTDAPLTAGETVDGCLDWPARLDAMQQHTGEHILSGALHRLFGAENVGFHIGSPYVRMDTSIPLTQEQLAQAEAEANAAVRADTPVHCWVPDPETLARTDYRSKKELTGDVRLVEAGGDCCACCGTHLARTGEVGLIKIISFAHYKSGMRLAVACGQRAYDAVAGIWADTEAAGRLLSSPVGSLTPALERLQNGEAALKARLAALQNTLAAACAEAAAPGAPAVLWVDGADGDGLRRGLSSRTDFLVDGVRCRQVGNICMDQCMFEVDLRSYARRRRVDPQVGDEVLIVGQQGDAMVTIEEMCETLGTIPHELCIGFAQRMPRYYV